MENNADVKPQNNTRKTLTIVLVSLLAAALVLGGVLVALKLKADREEAERQSIINSGTFHAGITVGGVDGCAEGGGRKADGGRGLHRDRWRTYIHDRQKLFQHNL